MCRGQGVFGFVQVVVFSRIAKIVGLLEGSACTFALAGTVALFDPWIRVCSVKVMHHHIPARTVVCVARGCPMRGSRTDRLADVGSAIAGRVINCERNTIFVANKMCERKLGGVKALSKMQVEILHLLMEFLRIYFQKFGCLDCPVRRNRFCQPSGEKMTNIRKGSHHWSTRMRDTATVENEADGLFEAFVCHSAHSFSGVRKNEQRDGGICPVTSGTTATGTGMTPPGTTPPKTWKLLQKPTASTDVSCSRSSGVPKS